MRYTVYIESWNSNGIGKDFIKEQHKTKKEALIWKSLLDSKVIKAKCVDAVTNKTEVWK